MSRLAMIAVPFPLPEPRRAAVSVVQDHLTGSAAAGSGREWPAAALARRV